MPTSASSGMRRSPNACSCSCESHTSLTRREPSLPKQTCRSSPSGGKSPCSSSRRMLSSYFSADRETGAKRMRTLMASLSRGGRGREPTLCRSTRLAKLDVRNPLLTISFQEAPMALQLGDTAPDFEAQTTEGEISFHDWLGDSWGVLFSHPKDFTPVCTTELGHVAKIKPEFDKRGVKVIGLSVDATDDHEGWANDIEETQGARPNYPLIGDNDFKVSKLYDMLPADTSGDAKARTAADNMTVRNVFIIGPDKKVKTVLVYPMTVGRNFDEVLRI